MQTSMYWTLQLLWMITSKSLFHLVLSLLLTRAWSSRRVNWVEGYNLKGKTTTWRVKSKSLASQDQLEMRLKTWQMVFQIWFLTWSFTRGKGLMKNKDQIQEYESTTATTICLTQPYHGSCRRVVADSWFSSVKAAVELRKRGLFWIMLVKTAHKNFQRALLRKACLQRGEWQSCTTEMIDGTNLQAVRFVDLQTKDFTLTSSTAIPGLPRKTKHHGLVQRPQVAEQYLKHAVVIDVHNHFQSGSCALEDVWHTKNPRRRQFAGILGFQIHRCHILSLRWQLQLLSQLTSRSVQLKREACWRSQRNQSRSTLCWRSVHQRDATCAVTVGLNAKEQNFLQPLNVVLVTSLSASLAKGITIMNILKDYLKKSGLAKTSLEKMTEYSVILVWCYFVSQLDCNSIYFKAHINSKIRSRL